MTGRGEVSWMGKHLFDRVTFKSKVSEGSLY